MGKIAIVGSSKLDEYQLKDALSILQTELNYRDGHNYTEIITGDAKGIDELARRFTGLFTNLGLTICPCKNKEWEPNGFKERNIKIANSCDELICIASHYKTEKCYHCKDDHQRTGGCWTMKYAKKLGKPTRLYVV